MTNPMIITAEQHLAAGEKRCMACHRWFKPNTAFCITRCRHCISVFFDNAVKSQWIIPIVNPAWPGMESAAYRQYMPST
jgi:hypothetical protein